MKQILLILLLALTIGCDNDSGNPDCSAVTCLAFSLSIKIVSADTNTNYIVENNITENDISIVNSNNEPTDFNIVTNSESYLFGAITVFATTAKNSTISIVNLDDMVISYTIIPPKTNTCCDFGSIENLMVDDYQFDFNYETNELTIYL